MRWPLPALAAWALCWALFRALSAAGAQAWLAALGAALVGLGCARRERSRLRALVIAAGFPLSLGALGTAALPAWAWLAALLLLWLLYPKRAWCDAPLFPTPHAAFDGLAAALPLPAGARVLDAGCGLGHGLRALQRAYPQARLEGVEWSWPLALLARVRCAQAKVHRADLWASGWAGFDLVYLFQRPESMAQAWAKANAEMRPGRWLVSLEFAVPGVAPTAHVQGAGRRDVWVYRLGPPSAAAPQAAARGSTVGGAGR